MPRRSKKRISGVLVVLPPNQSIKDVDFLHEIDNLARIIDFDYTVHRNGVDISQLTVYPEGRKDYPLFDFESVKEYVERHYPKRNLQRSR
jgi:hypothetical protein